MAVYSQPIDPTVYPEYHNYLVKITNGPIPLYPKDLIYVKNDEFNQFPILGSTFLYTFDVTYDNGDYIISDPENTSPHEEYIDDFTIIRQRYQKILDEKYNGDNTNITENYSENLAGYQKILYFLDENNNLLTLPILINSVSHNISFNSYNNSSGIEIGYNIDTANPFVLLFGYYFDDSGNMTSNFELRVNESSDMYFSNITNTSKIVMYGTKEIIPYQQPNYVEIK